MYKGLHFISTFLTSQSLIRNTSCFGGSATSHWHCPTGLPPRGALRMDRPDLWSSVQQSEDSKCRWGFGFAVNSSPSPKAKCSSTQCPNPGGGSWALHPEITVRSRDCPREFKETSLDGPIYENFILHEIQYILFFSQMETTVLALSISLAFKHDWSMKYLYISKVNLLQWDGATWEWTKILWRFM